MSRSAQNSFAGGVLGPSLHSRRDLAKYSTGLARAYNTIIAPDGGVSNRLGSKLAQQIKQSALKGTRLIGFQFNVIQQYILEFGEQYMRVIKNGSYVYDASRAVGGVDITTTPGKTYITNAAHPYLVNDEVFVDGIVGTDELNGRPFLIIETFTNSFRIGDLQGNDIGGTNYTAYVSGGTIEKVYEAVTPYALADLQMDPDDENAPGLKYTQSHDTMTLTHPSYATRSLTRTAHNAWTFALKDFEPDQVAPTGINVAVGTAGTHTTSYAVTAVNEDNEEESLAGLNATAFVISAATQANPCVITLTAAPIADVNDEIFIDEVVGMVELNGRRFTVEAIAGNNVTLKDEDSTTYTAYSSAGKLYDVYDEVTNSKDIGAEDNTITWVAAANAIRYNIYKRYDGLFGYIGSTQLLTFTDTGALEDESDTPPRFRNPFETVGDYPGCTTYYQQRQAYGGSVNKPQNLFMSQSAAFDNFTYSSPRKDNDAIERRLNAKQANPIRHLVPVQDLVALTAGVEWLITGGADGTVTPVNISARPQSNNGSSHAAPLIVGSKVIYTHRSGRSIFDFGYQTSGNDSGNNDVVYAGDDRTILVPHIFESARVIAMTFVAKPDNLVWVALSNGKFASMTYLPEQDVWAWCEHETYGVVEDLASAEETDGPVLYILTKRVINGITKRFIEFIPRRYFEDDEDAFFVDCGLTLDSPMTITGFTNASPVVVTAVGHTLITGDDVDIANVKVAPDATATDATVNDSLINAYKYDAINMNGWTVGATTANTFELLDSDSVDVDGTAWRTYSEGGEARKAVAEVGGLWHLIGQQVTSLGNGSTQAGLTVSSEGKVTLTDPSSRVHVGIPFYSEIETLDLEAEASDGTTQSRRKRIPRVYARVLRTRGIKMGYNSSKLAQAKQGLNTFFTGVIGQNVRAPWQRLARVVIRQDNPLPMTVLAISTRPSVEEDA